MAGDESQIQISNSTTSSLRAKRSNPFSNKARVDCFVASLLAMTSGHSFAISPRDAREFCLKIPPSSCRGRRECRALDAPAASRAIKNKAHERSHHGHTGFTRHSPRNGFNGFLRALPGDRACLPPSPAEVAFRKLDASVGASGPHDFAVRISALRLARLRVHRIPCRVDKVGQRPSFGSGRATSCL